MSNFSITRDGVDGLVQSRSRLAVSVAVVSWWIAVVVLAVTAVLKLIGVFQTIPLWETNEPLFDVPFRPFLVAVALGELLVAILILRTSDFLTKGILLAIPCLGFIGYRIANWLSGIAAPCSCLGVPDAWWPWLATNQQIVSATMLFLLVASTAILIFIGYIFR